jgi:hypothetical protein
VRRRVTQPGVVVGAGVEATVSSTSVPPHWLKQTSSSPRGTTAGRPSTMLRWRCTRTFRLMTDHELARVEWAALEHQRFFDAVACRFPDLAPALWQVWLDVVNQDAGGLGSCCSDGIEPRCVTVGCR